MTKKLYKIRRISDGLFATAGSKGTFNKEGKIFTGLNYLKSHLREVERSDSDNKRYKKELPPIYEGCEIVEFEIEIIKETPIPLRSKYIERGLWKGDSYVFGEEY